MNRPPLVARVGFRRGSLWLPLFLVWLLLLVLLLPALLLFLVFALFAPRRWRMLPLAGGLWAVLCATRGTQIEVVDARHRVSISLF